MAGDDFVGILARVSGWGMTSDGKYLLLNIFVLI
jgi:hypothetical protein